MKELSLEQWETEFRPVKNKLNPNRGYNGTLFETFEEDREFIIHTNKTAPDRVWTLLSEDRSMWIASGYHWVNRLGYFVTEVPFTEDTEIMIDDGSDDEDLSTD